MRKKKDINRVKKGKSEYNSTFLQKQRLIDHWNELRLRFISVSLIFFIVFLVVFFNSSKILRFVINRFTAINIVSLTPFEIFISEVKLSAYLSLFLISPFIIYNIYAFISPALSQKERKKVRIITIFSYFLFILGFSFSLFIVIPVVVNFFSNFSNQILGNNFWRISNLIAFLFNLSFSFGVIFQLPLFIILLRILRLIDASLLNKLRPYVYVSIFIVSAIITPPDALSQILLAMPLILLYEISILLIKLF